MGVSGAATQCKSAARCPTHPRVALRVSVEEPLPVKAGGRSKVLARAERRRELRLAARLCVTLAAAIERKHPRRAALVQEVVAW